MYAGSGNKITIKRKAAAIEESDISQHELDTSQPSSVAGSVKCISSQIPYGSSSQRKSSKSSKVL